MEDNIEIVIKISEKEYNEIKENKFGVFGGHIYQAIRDGKPLSEYYSDPWMRHLKYKIEELKRQKVRNKE